MKIIQKKTKIIQKKTFKPITIILETAKEANTFISLVDLIDGQISHSQPELPRKLTAPQKEMVIKISNEFTNYVGLRE